MATSISEKLKTYCSKKESEREFRKEAKETGRKKQKGHKAGDVPSSPHTHTVASAPWLFMSDPSQEGEDNLLTPLSLELYHNRITS